MDKQQDRIEQTINSVVDLFKSPENLPEAIAINFFPAVDKPSNAWSLTNRLIAGKRTTDARGFKQWQAVGRSVKKGESAIWILAPRMVSKEKTNSEGEKEKTSFLAGFLTIPVFGLDQTEGEPMEYQKKELPKFQFLEKAEEWGIKVESSDFTGDFLGYYGIEDKVIRLASPNVKTFFHELAHAAHRIISGEKKFSELSTSHKEIVAELSAAVLLFVTNHEGKEGYLKYSYSYLEYYAKNAGKSLDKAILGVLAEVEKVLKKITE